MSVSGDIRVVPEDFIVEEELGFAPDGEGEHVLLHIRKRDQNTAWVARSLARFTQVPARDVSYAGLKDRRALTSQWFSIRLAGAPEPDWDKLELPGVELLDAARHRRKLRRGALKKNHFRIRLRNVTGDRAALQSRVATCQAHGFPNYFGSQRFGHGEGNLDAAQRLFRGELREKNRHRRGLYLSAARSWLFNQVLQQRARLGNWNVALEGDVFMLNGTHSVFTAEATDKDIIRRLAEQDIHPTGPLWGRGNTPVSGATAVLEMEVLENDSLMREGLERFGLEQARRALRVAVPDLHAREDDDDSVEFDFSLPPGSYATVLLEQLMTCREGRHTERDETPLVE